MMALQELHGRDQKQNSRRCTEIDEESTFAEGPTSLSSPPNSKNSRDVHVLDPHGCKDYVDQARNILSISVVATDSRGPSSPAVVSATSQEDDDDEKANPSLQASGDPAARVVSLGCMTYRPIVTKNEKGDDPDSLQVTEEAVLEEQELPQILLDGKTKAIKQGRDLDEASPATVSSSFSDSTPPGDFSTILANPEAWLRTSEPLFSSSLSTNTIDTKAIITDGVQPNDVLCGRGGETNHHT